tara:strand:+ start:158 stop:400 length:243 start_codon:yes stop_codon:yes gene_type:complete
LSVQWVLKWLHRIDIPFGESEKEYKLTLDSRVRRKIKKLSAIDEARLARREQVEKGILLSVSATTFMDFGEKKRYMRFIE